MPPHRSGSSPGAPSSGTPVVVGHHFALPPPPPSVNGPSAVHLLSVQSAAGSSGGSPASPGGSTSPPSTTSLQSAAAVVGLTHLGRGPSSVVGSGGSIGVGSTGPGGCFNGYSSTGSQLTSSANQLMSADYPHHHVTSYHYPYAPGPPPHPSATVGQWDDGGWTHRYHQAFSF
jgi:hypothetical protein